jgi:stage II sporulation protein D
MGLRREIFLGLSLVLVVALMAFRLFGEPVHPRWRNVQEERSLLVYLEQEGVRRRMLFEEYLAGVVAGEMPGDWPRAALEAQAIIARTFTLGKLQRTGGTWELHGTDVCTNVEHFQAYNAALINDAIREAVKATRGLVIFHAGRPARTWFHADAAGITATPQEGLGYPMRIRYLPSLKVPTDARANAWTASFSKDEVRRAAQETGHQAADVSVVRVARRGPSGRATLIQIDDAQVPAPAFRVALDPKRLRSNLILGVRVEGDQVVFSGRGFGHGVGMSQQGARLMAEQGKTAREIIHAFYHRVEIRRQWE